MLASISFFPNNMYTTRQWIQSKGKAQLNQNKPSVHIMEEKLLSQKKE